MRTLLPPGSYYIGDPCYAFDEQWSRFLDETNYGEKQFFDGYAIAVGDTAYGDGCYKDQYGVEYPVDAGMIGAIPLELLSLDNKLSSAKIVSENYGRILDTQSDIVVEISDGIFNFGTIHIDTVTEEDDDNED